MCRDRSECSLFAHFLRKFCLWFYSIQTLYSETITTDIEIDDSKSFIANIGLALYLSQIVVWFHNLNAVRITMLREWQGKTDCHIL